jgi:hypothetical protein
MIEMEKIAILLLNFEMLYKRKTHEDEEGLKWKTEAG